MSAIQFLKQESQVGAGRRHYNTEFKHEVVRMLLDGYAAASIADRQVCGEQIDCFRDI